MRLIAIAPINTMLTKYINKIDIQNTIGFRNYEEKLKNNYYQYEKYNNLVYLLKSNFLFGSSERKFLKYMNG